MAVRRHRFVEPHLTSLVLPAYNPGIDVERARRAVGDFLAERARRGDPWEAVFVLDGCTDGTAERLARLAEADAAPVRVVSYPRNRGKGYAVRTGLLAARGARRIFTDVDLAYSFDDVLRVAEALRAGADVAIAAREHPDSRLLIPAELLGRAWLRHLQSRAFGAIARALLPLAHTDTQAGLKGMTAAVAERVAPALQCDGFGFDCELLTACARAGLRVDEVPVCVRYDTAKTTTGPRSGLRMLRELWTVRRYWRRRSVPAAPRPAQPEALAKAA